MSTQNNIINSESELNLDSDSELELNLDFDSELESKFSSNLELELNSKLDFELDINDRLFEDNMDYIEQKDCLDIDIINYDELDFEIINESKFTPIKNRYRKISWKEYFKKVYNVSIILIISIIIYIYYSCIRKSDIISKL